MRRPEMMTQAEQLFIRATTEGGSLMRISTTVLMLGAAISTSILFASSAQAAVAPDETASGDEAPWVQEFDEESLALLDEEEAAAVWQLEAGPIIKALREQFPDDFAVAWIRDKYVEVAFAAATPPDATAIIDGSRVPIKAIEGFGASEVQMATISREIHNTALTYVGEGVAVTSGPIPDRKVYQVEFASENDDSVAREALDRHVGQLEASLDDAFSTDTLGGFTIETYIADTGAIGDASWGQAGGTALNARLRPELHVRVCR